MTRPAWTYGIQLQGVHDHCVSGEVPAAAWISILRRSSPGGALSHWTVTFGCAATYSSAPPLITSLTGVPRLKTLTVTFSAEVAGFAASTGLVGSAAALAVSAGFVGSAALGASVGLAGGAVVGAAPAQAASNAPEPIRAPLISLRR